MKASQDSRREPPHVLLLNQSVGPLFLELAVDVAREWGLCHLITGTPVKVDNADLAVHLLAAYDRRNVVTRALSWLRFSFGALKEISCFEPTVLLLVLSNPPLLPLLAWLAHLVRRQPYVVLVYDIYPDMVVSLGVLSDNHPVTRVWRWLNRQAYRHAARVITIGCHMAQALQRYMPDGRDARSVDVVPTWVDTERFIPRDKMTNPFAAQIGYQDKLTVLYSGNIGFSHDVSPVIEAAIRLRDEPCLHFLIIGDGPGKPDLVRKAQMAELDNVTFLPLQPEEMLPYSLAVADVATVSIRRNIERLMMPSKTYYAMAVGSALVGISQPPNDLAELIEESGCGVNVEPGDVDGLVAALRRLAGDVDYRNACRQAARKVAVERFSRALNTRHLLDLLQSVSPAPQ